MKYGREIFTNNQNLDVHVEYLLDRVYAVYWNNLHVVHTSTERIDKNNRII